MLEVGWSQDLGPWDSTGLKPNLLAKTASYLGLGPNAQQAPNGETVEAVIVVKLYGGNYAAANGQLGMLAFLVRHGHGVSERIQLGAVGVQPWAHVEAFSARCFPTQADMGNVTDAPFPPTEEAPRMRVALRTVFDCGEAGVPAYFEGNPLQSEIVAKAISWLQDEENRNRLNSAHIEINFYSAWSELVHLAHHMEA